MEISRKEKDELAKRIDIASSTFYKYEKTKPELIKLLLLGLQKEKELSLDIENIDNEVETMNERILRIEEQMKLIKINENV